MPTSRAETRPMGLTDRRLEPNWMLWGDDAAEVLVALILFGGLLTWGYATPGTGRTLAWIACGVLGMWTGLGLAMGRWRHPNLRAARMLFAGLLFLSGWSALQIVPLPSSWIVAMSEPWAANREAFEAAEVSFPAWIPWAQRPVQARESLDQLFAATLFFGAVCLLCLDRRRSTRLLIYVAALAVLEGTWGVLRYVGGAARTYGGVYNPNHHAALVALGLPSYFALLWRWQRRRRRSGRPAGDGGTSPVVFFAMLGLVAVLGWVCSFSRASLILGLGLSAAWLLVEVVQHLKSGGLRRRVRFSRAELLLGTTTFCFLTLSLLLLIVFGSVLDGLLSRGAPDTLTMKGRTELWQATLQGLAESPLGGLGLGGASAAINRFATIPLMRVPTWSHSDFVQLIAEAGLPAALIFGGFAGVSAARWLDAFSKRSRVTSWRRGLVRRSAMAGAGITVAHALLDFHLRIPLIGFGFLVLLALSLCEEVLVPAVRTSPKRSAA